jgi:hypothetical protein
MSNSAEASTRSRTTINLNNKLEGSLLGYIAAAGAAGVALMAVAQPVAAEVVYTPLNNVPLTSLGNIDLNGDGVTDFRFVYLTSGYGAFQYLYPMPGNSIAIGVINNSSGALPLPWLTRIGPNSPFQPRDGGITAVAGCHSYCHKFGLWQHQVDKYLGVKFQISGQTHYGWIRLVVQAALTGYASGYAYETEPNKPIIAGKTNGPVKALGTRAALLPVQPVQSLGALARGADGIAIWRREDEVAAA